MHGYCTKFQMTAYIINCLEDQPISIPFFLGNLTENEINFAPVIRQYLPSLQLFLDVLRHIQIE